MHLLRVYKAVENLAAEDSRDAESLLVYMLNEIVRNEEFPIKGGRLWKFDPRQGAYILIHQQGDIQKIEDNYQLRIEDYPIFLDLPNKRTILATETDNYLRDRGIRNYSATGIGEKIKWNNQMLYQYLLAVNSDFLDEDFAYTLGIIGSAITAVFKSKTVERRAQILESDLDKAREIQRIILPEHEIRFHNYEVYGVSIPARIVGGDFFDYMESSEDLDRFGFAIGDAASKGLSAAAQALYISGALRMGTDFQTKISSLMAKANKLMHRTFPEEQFVTLFYGELTKDKRGLLIYANAGHNSPMLLHAQNLEIEHLAPTGQMLGPFPNQTYNTESTYLDLGDVLLMYTDGVTEARNEKGEFYGEDRLAELLRTHRTRTAKEITQLILEDVETFAVRGDQSDDMTLVVIRRIS
jgi:sigma-B regulation protein RsbU (phosphoserine phosphatase)